MHSTTLPLLICFTFLCLGNSFSNLDLSSTTLNPISTGFMMKGSAKDAALGVSVSSAGDVDNDGYDDIIVGAWGENGNRGAVYVIYGQTKYSMPDWDFSSGATLNPSTTGFKITGNAATDQLGYSVSKAGDINNDGYDDIIIGAPNKNSVQGAAYVIYGGQRSSMSHIDLSSKPLDPLTTGFTITGNVLNGLGNSVSTAGDINKDGFDDIIVGAYAENSKKGAAYVIYGGTKSSMSDWDFSSAVTLTPSTTGFKITGDATSDQFGVSVRPAGDINNDGFDDIIVGASGKNSKQGAAYVIYGDDKSNMVDIDLNSVPLDPLTTGFMITGNAGGDNFAVAVATAGDVNKDGYDDIVIGGNAKDGYRGVAYVIYGGDKSTMSNIALSSTPLDPQSTGFMMKGNAAADFFGCSVNSAGDINNDGFGDIIVGAFSKDKQRGAAYVIYGGANPTRSNIDLSSKALNPSTTGFKITGNAGGDLFGYSVSKTGDGSLIISAPEKESTRGRAYIIYSCTFQGTCPVCPEGYTLSGSVCVLALSSSQLLQGKATRAIASTARVVSSVVCLGSTVAPLAALISKIVQSTRYLNLTVTSDLSEVYQTWNTELISWDIPNAFSNQEDKFKPSPYLFAQYGDSAPFLVNFWATLVDIIIGSGTFFLCIVTQRLMKKAKYEGRATSWVQNLKASSFNFALIQSYACLDDIMFYFVLDAKTNSFNTFFAVVSMICAILTLICGFLQVYFNFWTVKKYQSIKKQGEKEIEAFNEKNKYWELFYSDFSDDNFWSQSFFAIIIIRSTLSSFIITVLFEHPLAQTILLLILDGVILWFLYFKMPFTTLRAELAQYYYEIIALLVHLCTFILSLNTPLESTKIFFSTAIVYLNTALIAGTISFMFIEIYKTIKHKIEKMREKKGQSKIPEENHETLNLTQSAFPLQHSVIDDRKSQYLVNEEQIQNTTIENFNFASGTIQNANVTTNEVHMESSRVRSLPDLEMNPRHRPINQSTIVTLMGSREQEDSTVSPSNKVNHEQK